MGDTVAVGDGRSSETKSATTGTASSRPAGALAIARGIARLLGRGSTVWLLLGVIGSVLTGGVELAISLVLQLFLASIGLLPAGMKPGGIVEGIRLGAASLVLALIGIALVRALAQFFVQQSSVRVLEVTNARLRRLAVYELLLAPRRGFVPAAAVHARLSDVFPRATQFCFFAAALFANVIQTILIGGVMIVTAWRESLMGLVGLGIVGLLTTRINRRIRSVTAQIPKEQLKLTEAVERVARNLLLIRTLRIQSREHGRFASSIDNYLRHSLHAYVLNNFAMVLPPFAGLLLVTAIIVYSRGHTTTSPLALLSFLYLFVRFVQAVALDVQLLASANQFWAQFTPALEYSDDFTAEDRAVAFRAESEIASSARLRERTSREGGAAPAIAIKDVTFTHRGRDAATLVNVSAEIPSGTFAAITGASGSGKSTLLAVILGLLDPTSGEVRVDDRASRDYFDAADTRVGYVGAEPYLIAGSIRDNVVYGAREGVTDEAIWDALEAARLADTVKQLPGQLTYKINEDGSGLSAGQKQRLCLARALLQKPHVLVLDEVSANLDDTTEREIAATLAQLRGTCTMLVVSHRAGLIEFADYRLSLDVTEHRT